MVQITVSTDGRLAGVRLTRSTGDAKLDEAVLAAIRRIGRLSRAPKGIEPGNYPYRVPIAIKG